MMGGEESERLSLKPTNSKPMHHTIASTKSMSSPQRSHPLLGAASVAAVLAIIFVNAGG
jgi:hypothetical protein